MLWKKGSIYGTTKDPVKYLRLYLRGCNKNIFQNNYNELWKEGKKTRPGKVLNFPGKYLSWQ